MPSMLAMPSVNYDYDYDTVQPYFLLDCEEEDFYLPPCSQHPPGPGEDIWKKFELLPTPPLSPSRRPSLSNVPLSAAEHLEAVTDLLDEDCNPSAALLQSFIIQDCMWSSSFAAATKLERVVSERLALLQARRDSTTTRDADGVADQQVSGSQESTTYLKDLHAAAPDCIDPSVVFPCPTLSEKSNEDVAMEVASKPCLDSPPLSSSDSESEEEEEEEEEDVEVDVVTVDRRTASRRSESSSRRSISPLVLKRSHIDIHQHNYAAQQPVGKRLKPQSASPAPRQSGRACSSPRSDGEDHEDKRRIHNVLERQRRNELKMSFLTLRDEIPALANNDRAAKVVILKKATEFIKEMRVEERRLLTTKDELRRRSKELRHRLKQLRTL